jgi:predicted O-linked N-acetylglucosamine transferase (SPINDLY family)
MKNIQKSINLAIRHYQSGNLKQAEEILRELLKTHPNEYSLLGTLANILRDKGQLDEAITSYQKVLQLHPNDAGTHYNLGNAFKAKGQFDSAISHYQQAIAFNPNFIGSYLNLGNIFRQSGDPARAVSFYRQALERAPDSAAIMYSLAQAYQDHGLFDEAILYYKKTVELDPNNSNAYFNMGNTYKEIRQLDNAVACYQQALNLNPDLVEAMNNLGNTLSAQGRLEEASEVFHKLLQLTPDSADALGNLGNILSDKNLDGAESSYKRAMALKPDLPKYFSNLLLTMNYNPRYDASEIFIRHTEFAKRYELPFQSSSVRFPNVKDVHRPLRVGYVSPDFKGHSVAFFIEPVLAYHNKKHFEVFCFSDVPQEDEVTKHIRSCADHWRDISRINDSEADELIRRDKIDILVDLAGHTAHNRLLLFARKPTPVQVSWIGYPATTGLSAMDYKIVDSYTDPPGMTEQYYTEKLLRMPECFLCYRSDEESPEVGPLPALSAGHVTFGSCNNFAKVTPQMMDLWGKILEGVPGSRLLLKAKSLSDRSTREYVTGYFQQKGIHRDAIQLLGWQPSSRDHLETYNRIDIALDTFPYHGTTTTFEALWMGVPVVTLAGKTHASRVGVSILSNLELAELISHYPEEYITLAVNLAKDMQRLKSLRDNLRSRVYKSSLIDAAKFVRNLETSYRHIWEIWSVD